MLDAADFLDVFRQARTWLAVIGNGDSIYLRGVLQALFGVWICDRALQDATPSAELRGTVQAALASLNRELRAGSFDPYSYDPKLLLLCMHILAQNRCEPPSIRAFAESIADALIALPTIPHRHIGVAAILYELGYRKIRISSQSAGPTVDDADSILTGGPQAARAACSLVAAASHFGARRIPGRHVEFDALRRTLPVILLQSLRSYDLDTAAMLLRAAHYLRMRLSRQLEDAVLFLVDQQRNDGSFGYFAVEVTSLRQSRESGEFDEILKVYLPVTTTCVWSVAEMASSRGLLFDGASERYSRATPKLKLSSPAR